MEAERLGEKLLIRNYGHGGAGVALSWGTARMAVDLTLEEPDRRAGVLGCGAVGLATARLLQDHGFDVTMFPKGPWSCSLWSATGWSPMMKGWSCGSLHSAQSKGTAELHE